MQWDSGDHFRWEVVEFSGWSHLEKYTGLQDGAGVYIFASPDFHVKYVGKAGARRMIDAIAGAVDRGKAYGATRVKALYTKSDANAVSLEKALINKYNPPNNR